MDMIIIFIWFRGPEAVKRLLVLCSCAL